MNSECIVIRGGNALSGRVRISGAKNSALPLLFATVLTAEPCELSNVPNLEDIHVTLQLLAGIGARCSFSQGTAKVHIPDVTCSEAPYSLVKAMRASFWVLGPLLARTGQAWVSLPGGDAIGTRPVNLHLDGLQQLGAEIQIEHGVVYAAAPHGLHGARIHLDFPSVGATHHLLLTAARIPEETIITGAAQEPEIGELCHFLQKMGAEIEGIDTDRVRIFGSENLRGAKTTVLGDRIEAATYLIAAAITQGKVTVSGISPQAIGETLSVLERAGCSIAIDNSTIALKCTRRLKPVSFQTAPFPGLATDVQPLLMAAMTMADGVSTVKETIFENRFGHVAEYRRFGADIAILDGVAVITGSITLSGAPVQGLDIRAAAGLVLLGLAASGTTHIEEIHHLERGYDSLIENLRHLGADITISAGSRYREVVLGC